MQNFFRGVTWCWSNSFTGTHFFILSRKQKDKLQNRLLIVILTIKMFVFFVLCWFFLWFFGGEGGEGGGEKRRWGMTRKIAKQGDNIPARSASS